MLENDIKTIVAAFKPNLFYKESLPEPNDSFPVINAFVREVTEVYATTTQSRVQFEMRIYAPWPPLCNNFDDVLMKTRDDVDEYRKYLRTFIKYLRNYFRYSSTPGDQFNYRLYPYQVSEHNYIAVSVSGSLYEKGQSDCCEDMYFDFDVLPSLGWGA